MYNHDEGSGRMARNAPVISIPHKRLVDFCRFNHIRKLSFFGSVLSDTFGPESDVDVLVEFEPGQLPQG